MIHREYQQLSYTVQIHIARLECHYRAESGGRSQARAQPATLSTCDGGVAALGNEVCGVRSPNMRALAGRMRRPECYAIRFGQFAEALAVQVFISQTHALFRRELPNWWPTNALSIPPCFSDSCPNPFSDQCSLELRDCAEYLKDQLAGRERRVDGFSR